MTNMQNDREEFEKWMDEHCNQITPYGAAWEAWQEATNRAVPDGYILLKKCTGCDGRGEVGNILETVKCPYCLGMGIEVWQEAIKHVVPVVTDKMLEAGMNCFDFPLDNARFNKLDLECAFNAMIEAAQEHTDECI